MKSIFIKLMLVTGIFMICSCEFDQLDDPNSVTLKSADVSLLLNAAQRSFAAFHNNIEFEGNAVTRVYHQGGNTYEVAYTAVSQNTNWSVGNTFLQDIKVIKKLADENKFRKHGGIAKTLEAYVLMTLVDKYGDIPYSKALDPKEFNPPRDKGDDVYKAALALLISAQGDFKDAASVGTPNDLFYGADFARWEKLCNTLQLKYWLNRRLINKNEAKTAIDALIAKKAFLNVGDEFVWRYGASLTDPDTRNPNYQPNGGGAYQSTYFMWHMTEAKGFVDPRAHYYFYRQVVTNPTNISDLRCLGEFTPSHYPLDMIFCLPGSKGYWGRDHVDNQGIPPDNLKRTLFGVYPVGGIYDNGTGGSASSTLTGNGGAGLEVVILPAYVDFMLAEAALELGTQGNPKELLLNGISKHVNFVRSWSRSGVQSARILAHKTDANHIAELKALLDKVSSDYDASSTQKDKMRIIAREYWLSLFGSGNETFNLYRRTGQPDGMQPGLVPNIGKFPRSFFYPADHVERNNQAPQKADHDVKVFWDTNPDKLN